MKVAIHQPCYMPWLGYLRKMKEADLFVYIDKATYQKNDVINRNRILVAGEEHWLTVPVLIKGKSGQLIKDVRVDWGREWNLKHYRTLLYNYPKEMRSKKEILESFFLQNDELLINWCIRSIDFLRHVFRVRTPIMFESVLDTDGMATERLVNICKKLEATTYLSGPSGRDYINESKFGSVKVEYFDWIPKSRLSALHFYLKDELSFE